jgi:hypothetical protein
MSYMLYTLKDEQKSIIREGRASVFVAELKLCLVIPFS